MRSSFIGLALVGALFASSAWAEKLIVANEGSYPPFSITKPDGTLTGIDVEVVRELCRRIQADCEFQVMEFKAYLPSIIAGRVDMIGGGLSPKPERLEATEFLDPHVQIQDGWLLPADWGKGIEDADLKGKRIGVIKGAAWIDFMEKQRPGVEIVTYDGLPEIFLDMEAGRIDGGYGPELGWAQVLASSAAPDRWKFIGYTFEGRPTVGNSFAVQKGNIALRDRLNRALNEMFADCTYTKIRKELVPVRLSDREPESCL